MFKAVVLFKRRVKMCDFHITLIIQRYSCMLTKETARFLNGWEDLFKNVHGSQKILWSTSEQNIGKTK